MRVFVICDHEPLPVDPGDRRLMRAGMLTAALAEAGHSVTWFTSSFDHYLKRQRTRTNAVWQAGPGLAINVLATPGYRSNISARRVLHNIAFAAAFKKAVKAEEPPDIVIAAIPPTDSAAAAVRYARQCGAASIVDVYDPWPDSFRQILSRPQLVLAAPLMARLHGQARYACANATGLIAISQSYLEWGQKKGMRQRATQDRVFPLSYVPVTRVEAGERGALLARLGIEPRHRVVSFVGTWGATHDLGLVVAAAEQLVGSRDIRFIVAGHSEGQPRVRASLAQLRNVALPGWLNARELAILLDATDVGLLPYRADAPQSLPNKIFEYMAHGVFQIASLKGEVEQTYERTGAGWVVPPTGDALAAAIRRYFDSPERTRRGERIATFNTNFAGAAVYRDMVAHIERVAAARS